MRGVYTLILFLEDDLEVGKWRLGKGIYCYTGSGMSNLLARVKRHFRREKKVKWHIDLMTTNSYVAVLGAVIAETDERMECKVNKELEKVGKAVRGFGNTDCKEGCRGHLVKGVDLSTLMKVYRNLGLEPLIWDNGIVKVLN